ncbi:MAG: adenylyltransferase/cytidyltransferase family protein [Tissierellia bacterium]|nr:adenylyltransferase/cytidyltransferase family protein [Tissierellia bacterium]
MLPLAMDRIQLELPFEKKEFVEFLETAGLRFEPCEEYYVLRDAGKIIATGAIDGNRIKLLATAADHRETGLLPKIVTGLKDRLYAKGHENVFLFTKPTYGPWFTSLGFQLLVKTDEIAFLVDRMDPYVHFIDRLKGRGSFDGAIVMNANPFTLGHRYLVEEAIKQCERLIIFVVEEDCSRFSYEKRLEMVQSGTSDLNVTVVRSGPFMISKNTFPTYFLKESSDIGRAYAKLDAALYFERIAKDASIQKRFVGTEQRDDATAMYNEVLSRKAMEDNFQLIEIPRKIKHGEVISASLVRQILDGGPGDLSEYVPESTLRILNKGR